MPPGTGSKPTADNRRQRARTRWVIVGVTTAVVIAFLLIIIVPRASDVGDALGKVGAERFAAIVLLGVISLICRTAAWQVAVDAAGGDLHAREAHAASSLGFTVGLLNPYLGSAVRIGVIRRITPERSPTASQLVAAESAMLVVETALVSILILCASWTLGIPVWAAAVIVIVAAAAVLGLVVLSRRWTTPRFAAGLAVAREPRPLTAVTAATAGALVSQLGRVAVSLSSVGLHASPIVVIAVFVASGVSLVIPIGTAAAGAAAPLIAAAGSSGEDVANASAAGVLLSGALMVSALVYAVIAGVSATHLRAKSHARDLR
jgi:uncharacterized membrane protein YbhN (UPF0104 family)